MNANNSANDEGAAFGSTTSSAPIRRGYSFLKQTVKSRSPQPMRKCAAGPRTSVPTYEDYKMLDLQKVVSINTVTTAVGQKHRNNNGNVTAAHKDLEFAVS